MRAAIAMPCANCGFYLTSSISTRWPPRQSLYDTGADYFYRSPDRVAPHNLYAYPAKVRAHVAALGKWTKGTPVWTLPHKADAPLATRPASGSIDIAFSSSDYAVHYDFDRATDTYLRSMGGSTPCRRGERRAPRPG